MRKSLGRFAVALFLYPVLWILGFHFKSGAEFGHYAGRWFLQLVAVGMVVLALLWFVKLKESWRGLFYVVGMVLLGFVVEIWQFRTWISKPDYGWQFFLSGYWPVLPIYVGCALLVLFGLRVLPATRSKGGGREWSG